MLEGSCHCGAVRWRFHGTPESATACNCSICRRYGTLWAYDYDGEGIETQTEPGALARYSWGPRHIDFCFCARCGCVSHWRGRAPDGDGRTRIAVNLRLAEPETVAAIPLQQFDGLVSFDDLPRDGRCVADLWF